MKKLIHKFDNNIKDLGLQVWFLTADKTLVRSVYKHNLLTRPSLKQTQ